MRSLRLGAEARVTDQRWRDGWPSAEALAIAPIGTEDCGPEVTPQVSPDTVNRELADALRWALGQRPDSPYCTGNHYPPRPESEAIKVQRKRYRELLRERDRRIDALESQVVETQTRLQARWQQAAQSEPLEAEVDALDAQTQELRHLCWALLVGALRVATGEADAAERDTLVAMWRWMHEQQRSLVAGPFGPD